MNKLLQQLQKLLQEKLKYKIGDKLWYADIECVHWDDEEKKFFVDVYQLYLESISVSSNEIIIRLCPVDKDNGQHIPYYMIKEKKFSRDRKKLALFDTKEEADQYRIKERKRRISKGINWGN